MKFFLRKTAHVVSIALALAVAPCGAQTFGTVDPPKPGPTASSGFGIGPAANATTAGAAATTPADASATGKFGVTAVNKGSQLGKELTSRYQIGMVVTAQGGPCTGLYGTAPVPINWPEQSVQLIQEDFSPAVQGIEYRMIAGTVRQMLVAMPLVPPGIEARATVTLEIRRYSLLPPPDTNIFRIPDDKKLAKELRPYTLPSPYIESTHPRIRGLAKQVMTENKDKPAWQQVEAIYDWVRAKVTYVNGPLKGAIKSLQDGNGDCEELSSLFIAMCRASGVPARIVWVPDHCYPEFYLEDADGNGYWFPCQAAGTREFGGITEHRPILQKGDNFRVPEKPRDPMRYVAEYLTGKGGNPKVKFIREMLDSGS